MIDHVQRQLTHLQGTTKQGFLLELAHDYIGQHSQDKPVCSLIPPPNRHSCHEYTCKKVKENVQGVTKI